MQDSWLSLSRSGKMCLHRDYMQERVALSCRSLRGVILCNPSTYPSAVGTAQHQTVTCEVRGNHVMATKRRPDTGQGKVEVCGGDRMQAGHGAQVIHGSRGGEEGCWRLRLPEDSPSPSTLPLPLLASHLRQ